MVARTIHHNDKTGIVVIDLGGESVARFIIPKPLVQGPKNGSPVRINRTDESLTLMERNQIERFIEEWKWLATDPHPSLLRTYELVQWRGHIGYRCERLNFYPHITHIHPCAKTVGTWLKTGIQLSEAAACMHEHGWVHLDITPRNVGVRRNTRRRSQRAVLIDFGFRVPIGSYPSGNYAFATNIVLGTICYMAPEQCITGARVYATADVHNIMLVLLSYMLRREGYGGIAYNSEDTVLRRNAFGSYPYLDQAQEAFNRYGLPRDLLCCLNTEPAERIQSAQELARAFRDTYRLLRRRDRNHPVSNRAP